MILEQVKKLATKVLVRFKGKDYLPDGPIRFGWHMHHDLLVEPLIEPIRDRVRWIMYHKCAEEIPIRLKWMRPVEGALPEPCVAKAREYCKARAAEKKVWAKSSLAFSRLAHTREKARDERQWMKNNDEVWAEYTKARDRVWDASDEYKRTVVECSEEITRLHAVECPGAPWDGNEMVFAAEAAKEEE